MTDSYASFSVKYSKQEFNDDIKEFWEEYPNTQKS